MPRIRQALLTLPLCLGLAMAAAAQPAPAATPAPAAAPAAGAAGLLFDPAQLPAFHGKVAQYTLTPRGGVDGLILDDGSQVHVNRRLSTQLAATVRPGDTVTIHGVKASSGALILAVSVTNDAGGKTLISEGMRRGMGREPMVAQGRIKAVLRNQRDEVDGVLLEDGSQIKLWPRMAQRMTAQLTPGQTLYASGFGQDTVLGKVVMPRRIGTTEADATEMMGPPGMMGRFMDHGRPGEGPSGEGPRGEGPPGEGPRGERLRDGGPDGQTFRGPGMAHRPPGPPGAPIDAPPQP